LVSDWTMRSVVELSMIDIWIVSKIVYTLADRGYG
jgi:hypothetical protein